MKKILLATIVLAASGCGESRDGGEPVIDHPSVAEARASFPTALELHTKVIARSCSPNNGVCHNTKEFPDLHTAGNFVTAVAKPCNLDVEEPTQIFDGCEPDADELVIDYPGDDQRTQIAWLGPDEYDEETGYSYRRLVLADPAEQSTPAGNGTVKRRGLDWLKLDAVVETNEGSKEARLVNTYMLPYQVYLQLDQVQGGDPNGNGVFGASQGWAEVVPGHPERSYLVGRITGTVPGSRMPLANQALSDPEYVAIFCWIETIGSHPKAEDRIDYDGCRFARDPVSYAVE